MSEQNNNKILELILNAINAGGELAILAIEAFREIKALSGKSDDELLSLWVSTAEANKVEIARRHLELAGVIAKQDIAAEAAAEMGDN